MNSANANDLTVYDLAQQDAAPQPNSGISFPPHTYRQSDNVVHNELGDFKKWIKANRPDITLAPSTKSNKLDLRSGDLWLPLAVIASDVTIPVYLNIVSNYIYDRLRGRLQTDNPKVAFKVQYEAKGKKRLLSFNGDARSFQHLISTIDINKISE